MPEDAELELACNSCGGFPGGDDDFWDMHKVAYGDKKVAQVPAAGMALICTRLRSS